MTEGGGGKNRKQSVDLQNLLENISEANASGAGNISLWKAEEAGEQRKKEDLPFVGYSKTPFDFYSSESSRVTEPLLTQRQGPNEPDLQGFLKILCDEDDTISPAVTVT